ncbi:TolC family protein [Duganella sp. FT3S]|uniref:TolC family protein n=1 Tax=Rugamonas fusca TaxID=2758568 RepID=A0A7W2EKW4_9BURK|nr:TolC family protein [Rugamonas fusca]MBA5607807.1 TolC family protein [Rugamonas fusca]
MVFHFQFKPAARAPLAARAPVLLPVRLPAFLPALLAATLAATLAVAPAAAQAQALDLRQAAALALAHNADLRLATLDAASADAAVTIAGAAPNPTLTLQSFNINPNAGVGAGSLRNKTVDSAIRIDQLIERGGKRRLRVASAGSLAAASAQDARETRRQVLLQVSQAYYDLLAAEGRLAIMDDSARLYDLTVEAARKRLKAGDLAPADVARVQVDALRAHNDAAQAGAERYAARQVLAMLIGQPEQAAQLQVADAWPAVRPESAWLAESLAQGAPVPAAPPAAGVANANGRPIASGNPDPNLSLNASPNVDGAALATADALQAALARRPDVAAAQARVEAAEAGRKLALAARSADVTVGVQAEHYPTSAANPLGSGNSFGIALQIPLQVRYAYQGELRAADLALDSAQQRLQQVRQRARAELELSLEQVRTAGQKLRRDDEELLRAAGKSADAAEFAFQRGALGIMDLLDVRRTYRSAQLDALAARADYAKSVAALQAAVSEGK